MHSITCKLFCSHFLLSSSMARCKRVRVRPKGSSSTWRQWSRNSLTVRRSRNSCDFNIRIICFIAVTVIFWALLLSYLHLKADEKRFGNESQGKPRNRGLIISLKKEPNVFDVEGFQYHPIIPFAGRPELKGSSSLWLLKSPDQGQISMSSLTNRLSRLTYLSVLIKYFISSPELSKLRVVAVNRLSHEEQTAELSQYGNGYCTRIIFFGLTQEVSLQGHFPSGGNGFIVIDEVLIGLGYFAFDGLDEETCS